MKFIDRAFGVTLLAFITGSLGGAALTEFSLSFRESIAFLLNTRAIVPLRAASVAGGAAVMLLVFGNNLVPAVLSFLYPLIIAKVRWTPPLQSSTKNGLLTAFSILTGGLVGFFNLGATLMLVSEIGGLALVNRLLSNSWAHAPLEFFFVLMCVAEPIRIAERSAGNEVMGSLREDLKLLFICSVGLLVSATIEVFASL